MLTALHSHAGLTYTMTHRHTQWHSNFHLFIWEALQHGLKSLEWVHFVWGICLPDTSVLSPLWTLVMLWTMYPFIMSMASLSIYVANAVIPCGLVCTWKNNSDMTTVTCYNNALPLLPLPHIPIPPPPPPHLISLMVLLLTNTCADQKPISFTIESYADTV